MELEEGWNIIENGLRNVSNILEGLDGYDHIKIGDTIMEIYTTVYNLCTTKHSKNFDELYNRYKRVLEEYINTKVLIGLEGKQGKLLVREVERCWKNHNVMIEWMSKLFFYVDRFYTSKRGLPSIEQVGLKTFADLAYGEIKVIARNALIDLIEREREGEAIEQSLVKTVVDIFVKTGMGDMNHYVEDFEKSLLEEYETYYARKAKLWVAEYSFPDYLLKVEECFKLEKDRISNYLHASSEEKLLSKLEKELLDNYKEQILEKGSGPLDLFKAEKTHDISRMYRLFKNISQALTPIANTFEQFVTAEGTEIFEQAAANFHGPRYFSGTQDSEFIQKLIELHAKYEQYVLECFQGNRLFDKALKSAFDAFCNKNYEDITITGILSSFFDFVLISGTTKILNADEVEYELDKGMKILSYILDKISFNECYSIKLARRLLSDKGTDVGNEESMLMKLKKLYGARHTIKMEKMVRDFTLAKAIQDKFEKNVDKNDVGLDLSVTVLNSQYWPPIRSVDVNLPKELNKSVDVFKQFYCNEARNQKLQWMLSIGNCIVEGRFAAKTIELVLSPPQTSVLMLFNDTERLSYVDIKTQLNVDDDEACRVLHSLSCSKYQILMKEPNSQFISRSDYFVFNSGFTDNDERIKVLLPLHEESKKVVESVSIEKRDQLQAAIARIMKDKRILYFQELQTECVKELINFFQPDATEIKIVMEELIERELLERDPNDRTILRYLP